MQLAKSIRFRGMGIAWAPRVVTLMQVRHIAETAKDFQGPCPVPQNWTWIVMLPSMSLVAHHIGDVMWL
jgi:uncharacterized membrane protein